MRFLSLRRIARLVLPGAMSAHGAAPAGPGLWRATEGDPQFVFRLGSAPLVVHARTGRAGGLAPRVYLDWGRGFKQDESFTLLGGRAGLFAFEFPECPDLQALRFDPFEGQGEVELRFGFGRRGAALAKTAGPDLAVQVDLRDYAPARRRRPAGRLRTAATAHEHFLHACALAAREFAEPPAPMLAISLVCPLYNTPPAYLDDLLASFRAQSSGLGELILSDDGSTSAPTAAWLDAHAGEPGLAMLRGAPNRGIAGASNAGIAAARGRWIGFIDHDDALAPHALAVLTRAIAQNPRARFLYTDELIADGKLRSVDFFEKPAFDDVLLSGVNYINHLSLYRRDLMDEVGGFREDFEGSQDYDLVLRATIALHREEVRHVPYPAYIWRRDGRSYSVKFLEKATASARRALGQAYARGGVAAAVEPALLKDLHRVRLAGPAARLKVSVVIPNLDAPQLLAQVVEGLARTDYPDVELIVVDNGSTDPQTLALYERLKAEPREFTLLMQPAPFNFSRQVNQGAARARGDAFLLLNNDIETLAPDWLAEMVECLAFPDVGVVGARLLYPDRTLQHAGVVVGLGGLAGHWFAQRPANFPGPMGRLAVRATMSAVTGACMLISRACWEATGGFDEVGLPVAYNDVDFCLRARAAGFRTLYTPFATLIHHESATRGPDARGPNQDRFQHDQALLIARHGTQDFLDPVLSPWHARDRSEPERIALARLPGAR